MPLPYAPPPKESKVYRDLKNLKVTGVTADQLYTLKGELYAQGVDGSEDEMRRLKLLGEVSNQQSSSGPIPGTVKIVSLTYDDNAYYDWFIPGAGEVWLATSFYCFTATGFTAGILSFFDSKNSTRIHAGDWGSGGGDLEDNGFSTHLYFDENTYPQFYPYGTLSSSSTAQIMCVRVR